MTRLINLDQQNSFLYRVSACFLYRHNYACCCISNREKYLLVIMRQFINSIQICRHLKILIARYFCIFYVTDGNIMYLTDASGFLISCVIQHYAPVVEGGGGTDA